MYELKRIRTEAIPAALAKAERYRLLNQPRQAESICLDILRVEPSNQPALVSLLLSLTDQFGRRHGADYKTAEEVLERITGPFERAYYEGMLRERWGKALLSRNVPARTACDWLREAMKQYDEASRTSPPGNDDAMLRWNACARLIMRVEEGIVEHGEVDDVAGFSDDAPII